MLNSFPKLCHSVFGVLAISFITHVQAEDTGAIHTAPDTLDTATGLFGPLNQPSSAHISDLYGQGALGYAFHWDYTQRLDGVDDVLDRIFLTLHLLTEFNDKGGWITSLFDKADNESPVVVLNVEEGQDDVWRQCRESQKNHRGINFLLGLDSSAEGGVVEAINTDAWWPWALADAILQVRMDGGKSDFSDRASLLQTYSGYEAATFDTREAKPLRDKETLWSDFYSKADSTPILIHLRMSESRSYAPAGWYGIQSAQGEGDTRVLKCAGLFAHDAPNGFFERDVLFSELDQVQEIVHLKHFDSFHGRPDHPLASVQL